MARVLRDDEGAGAARDVLDAGGLEKPRLRRGPAVAVPRALMAALRQHVDRAAAGDRGDHPVPDPSHAVVHAVGDEERPGVVAEDRHVVRQVQAGQRRGTPIAGEAALEDIGLDVRQAARFPEAPVGRRNFAGIQALDLLRAADHGLDGPRRRRRGLDLPRGDVDAAHAVGEGVDDEAVGARGGDAHGDGEDEARLAGRASVAAALGGLEWAGRGKGPHPVVPPRLHHLLPHLLAGLAGAPDLPSRQRVAQGN
mmetsp:Transcript_8887/g.26304  ORF Transcript_8887/g.26304 Transcript_8887/m.26304 type:complete len:253 (-) Transcript_8887:1716-2474(-)